MLTLVCTSFRSTLFSLLVPLAASRPVVVTDLGKDFGGYCGLTRIPKSDLRLKIPEPLNQFYHTLTVDVGKGTHRSTYQQQRLIYEVAQRYKNKGLTGLRIAKIDLSALPKDCTLKIVDLTTEENRDKYLGNAVCKNFAKASCEVLLECDVPIPCYVVDPPEWNFERFKKALPTWLLYGVSSMTV